MCSHSRFQGRTGGVATTWAVLALCVSAASGAESRAKGDGWLGVQLAPTPRSLGAHLRLTEPSLMVRNVIESSPADKADIAQFDLFLRIDGDPVPKEISEFADVVRRKGEGAQVTFQMIHRGERREVRLTLGSPPSGGELRYRYEADPDSVLRDVLDYRARILRPKPGGGYEIEDLGALPELQPLLPLFEMPTPELRRHWASPRGGAVRSEPVPQLRGFWKRDGGSIEIVRAPDGRITVVRTTKRDGRTSVEEKRYADAGRLKAGDPEAYELYRDLVEPRGREPGVRDDDAREGWRFTPPDRLMELLRRHYGLPAEPKREAPETESGEAAEKERAGAGGVVFSVDAEGRISATVREGDSELTLQFPDEQALREQYPKLHQQYQAMRERLR